MLDPFYKSGSNEVLLDNSVVLDSALSVCFQKLQLLDDIGIFLVILVVSVDVGKESPVVEVIDGILENGICRMVAPEATTEPGRERLHWFVRGIVRSGI